jgi:hypothetical protein
MRRLGRIPFILALLFIILMRAVIVTAQESAPTVLEYQFSDYVRHPRMEQEDRLRGRVFRYNPGLEIISSVDEVEVSLFDEKLGRTPWESGKLAPGSYRIKLERTGFDSQEFWITLRNDTRTVVVVVMVRSTGTLILKDLPPDAQVTIDREIVTGREIKVAAGERNLRVTAFGWEPVQTTIKVGSGETTEWTYSSSPADFSLDSLRAVPGTLASDDPRGFRLVWSASAPGTGKILISSQDGSIIEALDLDIDEPIGTIHWIPGSSPLQLPDGTYRIAGTATGNDGRTSSAESSLRIDSRFNRSPRMSYGPIPGLLYTPGSSMLPPGIWQISTGAGFDANLDNSVTSSGVPVSLSLRFSPSSGWEAATKLKIRVKDPFEQTGIGGDISVMWRAAAQPGPFSANMALSFSYMGYSSDFSRIPADTADTGLPGFKFTLPMEYGWDRWSLIFSPGIHILFLGDFAPVATAGEMGIGIYFEDDAFLIGGSAALRSPDAPGSHLDWTLWSGLESRINMPGGGSFFSAYCGLRMLDGGPVLSTGIDFGIIG